MFDFKLSKLDLFDRKIDLKLENTIIFGPPRVGKTFLVFNFLKSFSKKFKYVDCEYDVDINLNDEELVILDNFDFQLNIPKDRVVFIISQKNINIDGFKKIYLFGLDFEEFFSFDNTYKIETAFNEFLKYGNLPEVVFLNDYYKKERQLQILKTLKCEYNKYLLEFFIKHIGEKYSLYQIYTLLKKEIKISKDILYTQTQILQANYILFLLDKFNQPKAPKKIFFYNFGFRNFITSKKDPLYILENMIFLELLKEYDLKEIFYLDYVNFYIPGKRIILVFPFILEDSLIMKLQKIFNIIKKLNIKYIEVVTISNDFDLKYKDLFVEVRPFWIWVMK